MAASVDSTTQDFGGIGGHAGLKMQRLDLGMYATGGVALTAAILGVGAIKDVAVLPAGGYVPEYTGGVVKVYYADYSTSTDAALIEVATDTDLASVSFPALVAYNP